MTHGPQCPCCSGTDMHHSTSEPCWAEIQAREEEDRRMAEQAEEEARAELMSAVAHVYPDYQRTAGPEGLAELWRQFCDGIGPYDLIEWVGRRSFLVHPTYGLGDQVVQRHLPGPQKHGVHAAEIDTVQGRDGLWYVKTAFAVPGSGTWGQFRDPQATMREALEFGVTRTRERCRRFIDGPHATEVQRKWARQIDAWAAEQLTPKGVLEL